MRQTHTQVTYQSILPFNIAPYVLASVLACAVSACKEDASAPALDAKTSQLTARQWRIVASTSTENTQPPRTQDWYATMPTYRKDDMYLFKADNSLVFDEGLLKENVADPQTASGSWQFDSNQTALTITLRKTVPLGTIGSTSSTTHTIEELSATTLRLKSGTQTQTVVITLSN